MNNDFAVVLMNLGSPDSPKVKDVKKYLNQFLMDEKVIDYAYLWRLILVRGIIVPLRAANSAKAYSKIWWKEGSPLVVLTRQLADLVSKTGDIDVEIAMRYGQPDTKAAYDKLMERNPNLKRVLLVPLYPHYAMSSFETAYEFALEQHKKGKYPFKVEVLKPFYNDPDYIHSLSESIRPYLDKGYEQLLFSYHGLPERHMTKGDITGNHCMKTENCCMVPSEAHRFCYKHQCTETTRLVAEKLNLQPDFFKMSFQSRLGREEWVKPYTIDRLKSLPGEGIKKLLIICPAFVSDCLETLEEIAMEGKKDFLEAGGENYQFIPCLNTETLWVESLAKWIKEVDAGEKERLLEVNKLP
jgi:protoporphyrin/coproporphyrin ferrochelatase